MANFTSGSNAFMKLLLFFKLYANSVEDLVNVIDKLSVCYPLLSHKLDIAANKL